MISHLHIENIAVIKEADIYFDKGLNVLTGETGSGKSVIIDAINAALGQRVSRDMIRTGSSSFSVSAVFSDLSEQTIGFIESMGYKCEDNTILIYREFNINGKNTCKINGRPATASILKEIGNSMVNMYGQHESYSLFSPDTILGYIDKLWESNSKLSEYNSLYSQIISIRHKISELNIDDAQRQRKCELLRYQIEELSSVSLVEGELTELRNQKNMYSNSRKIMDFAGTARNILKGDEGQGVLDSIQEAVSSLSQASLYAESLSPVASKLQELYYEFEECSVELSRFIDSFEYDPLRLSEIEQRLDLLSKMSKKYGPTVEDMMKFLEDARTQLLEIEESKMLLEKLMQELSGFEDKALRIGREITQERIKAAKRLEDNLREELGFLDMPNVFIHFEHEEVPMYLCGFDRFKIMLSVNKGEAPRPFSKIASGGELSRIMLAIKNVMSDSSFETMIFDEIDSGVSGSAANKIGIRLKRLASNRQVICITHLAQIAALANHHFLIKKENLGDHTYTCVHKLGFNGRKLELARIIGGLNISELTVKSAEEMLSANNEYYKMQADEDK